MSEDKKQGSQLIKEQKMLQKLLRLDSSPLGLLKLGLIRVKWRSQSVATPNEYILGMHASLSLCWLILWKEMARIFLFGALRGCLWISSLFFKLEPNFLMPNIIFLKSIVFQSIFKAIKHCCPNNPSSS